MDSFYKTIYSSLALGTKDSVSRHLTSLILLVGLVVFVGGCNSESGLTNREIKQMSFNECMASANATYGDSPEFTKFANEACFPLLD